MPANISRQEGFFLSIYIPAHPPIYPSIICYKARVNCTFDLQWSTSCHKGGVEGSYNRKSVIGCREHTEDPN